MLPTNEPETTQKQFQSCISVLFHMCKHLNTNLVITRGDWKCKSRKCKNSLAVWKADFRLYRHDRHTDSHTHSDSSRQPQVTSWKMFSDVWPNKVWILLQLTILYTRNTFYGTRYLSHCGVVFCIKTFIHSFIHSYIRLKTRLTYRNPTTA